MVKRPKTFEENTNDYDAILKTVGSRLRDARLHAGLTQSQLGEKANFKQSYIFELETGGANITLRTLAKMADVLGRDPRDLLPESRSVPPSSAALLSLQAVLERVAALLSNRELEEAKRSAYDAELLAELRTYSDLRFALERSLGSESPDTAGVFSSLEIRDREKE